MQSLLATGEALLYIGDYMQYYFAPLEGLTDRTYRDIHHKHFPGIHRYYTPFLSPTVHRSLTGREIREIPPADELGYTVVPQVLTKNPEDFLWLAQQCADLGYREINLNLGCPSGTVTAKGKGSGMLANPEFLQSFLDSIFRDAPLPISIKTRIGFTSPDEFPALVEIFKDYPIKELTVHPRVRKAFYSGDVDKQAFLYALSHMQCPLCYNGDLCSRDDIEKIHAIFPGINAVMLGRGLIADPGMLSTGGTTAPKLESFHEELLQRYIEAFGSSRNAMFRLKEHWRHLLCKFENSEKLGKQLRKTTDLTQYREIVQQILHTCPIREKLSADWQGNL